MVSGKTVILIFISPKGVRRSQYFEKQCTWNIKKNFKENLLD